MNKPPKEQLEDIIIEASKIWNELEHEDPKKTRMRIMIMRLKDAISDVDQLQDDLRILRGGPP